MKRSDWLAAGTLIAATALVAAADLWFLKHRRDGWAYRPAAYAEVYQPAEHATIVDASHGPQGVDLRLSGDVEFAVDMDPRVQASGRQVHIDPGEGPIQVRWRPTTSDVEVQTRVDVLPVEPTVTSADVTLGRFDQLPLAKAAFSRDIYPPADVGEARSMLEAAGIQAGHGSHEQRWRQVWTFVHEGLRDHVGTPDPSLKHESALGQWKRVQAGTSQCYCAQFAKTFALFATVAGLRVREIDVLQERNGVSFAAHAFNEIYLPSQGRWVYTDATLGTLAVRHGERYLNAFELARAHQSGNLGELVHVRQEDGALRENSYADTSELNQRFLNPNSTFIYHRHYRRPTSVLAFAHRYFVDPEPTLSLHGAGARYRMQRTTLFATGSLAVAWLVALVLVVRRRRRHRATG